MTQHLTRAFFEQRLQTVFQVTPALGARPIGLTLQSITSVRLSEPPPMAAGDALSALLDDAYTLLFYGPLEPVLHPSIYMLRPRDGPEDAEETPFYVVPLGFAPQASQAMRYSVLLPD